MGVAQRPFQLVLFQQIAVGANLYLAASAQVGQSAKHGGVVPPVGFALEFLQQIFQRGTHATPIVALDERQQLLLGLGQGGGVVAEQPLL